MIFFHFVTTGDIIHFLFETVKEKPRQKALPRQKISFLLLAEGHTVGTLIGSGIHLMGAHHDAVQGTIVLAFAVVCALMDGTLDRFVGMAVHKKSLL